MYSSKIIQFEVFMEIILAGIGGWLIALLINYLADVLPTTRRISAPVCMHCEAKVSVSRYFFLLPCAACRRRRSLRTWIVQAAFSLATIWLWVMPPGRLGFWAGTAVLAFFALVGVIDIEHRLILHPISYFGMALGLAVGIWQKGVVVTLEGGAAGYGIMFALYYFGILFNRWIARLRHQETDEVALGYGDVNLAGILGLMLGWSEIAGVLIVAILLGGLASGMILLVMTLLRRYKPMTAIPYAPFLLIGAMIFLYIPKQ
jgi:prepilin signal peptidase PulO-like enzyme (type II secretory pathway)